MREERFEVIVTFDSERGYVASVPELREWVPLIEAAGVGGN
jgi:hypothetical protein